jgi:hypothetical protein
MRMCSGRRLLYCAAYSGCVGTVVGNCAPSSADRPGRFALVRHKRRAGDIDLEMNLAWELHRHFEWLRLSSSSIVNSLRVRGAHELGVSSTDAWLRRQSAAAREGPRVFLRG